MSLGLDGKSMKITKNLHLALSTIGPWARRNNLYIWADALSINQSDLIEKAAQVKMIAEIYSKANRVVAYLGTPLDRSFMGSPDLLQRLSDIVYRSHEADATHCPDYSAGSSWSDNTSTTGGICNLSPYAGEHARDSVWEEIFRLLNSPWWTRAWVVQEVICGPDPLYVYGDLAIPVDDMEYLQSYIIEQSLDGEDFTNWRRRLVFSKYLPIFTARIMASHHSSSHIHILQALETVNGQECKIPRDKVYAAVGMTHLYKDISFLPDYDKPLRDVLLDVVECCFRDDWCRKLNFLGCINTLYQDANSLPTWLPDWTNPISRIIRQFGFRRKASPKLPSELRIEGFHPHILDRTILQVHGWKVDYIQKVYASFPASFVAETCARPGFQHDLLSVLDLLPINSCGSTAIQHPTASVKPDVDSSLFFSASTVGRVFANTEDHLFGLFPSSVREGDLVCSFIGGCVFYVLRQVADQINLFSFIGEVFLFGEMDKIYYNHTPIEFRLV